MKNYKLKPFIALTSTFRSAKSTKARTLKAMAFVLLSLMFVSTAFAQRRVNGLTIGGQTGNPIYGTSSSATYIISLQRQNYGGPQVNDQININWIGGAPANSTVTFNPTSPYNPNNSNTITLTITTSATTLPNTYNFTITNVDNNGGGTHTTNPQSTFVVGKAPLTINANNVTKVYGAILSSTTGSVAFTPVGLVNGETVGNVTIAYGTGAVATATVGTYINQITPSNATGGTFNPANYTISYNTNLGDITVTPATLTLNGVTASNKVYDGTTTATLSAGGTLTGKVNGDNVNYSTTGTFASANVSNNIGITVALTGSTAGNYTLTPPPLAANINARPITLTANGPAKTYGTALNTAAGNNFILANGTYAPSQSATSVTLTPDAAGISANTPANATYVVTPSAATGTGGFQASNYSITYVPFTGTVTKSALTIDANNATKTYGVALATPVTGSTAYTPTGLQNGETIGTVTINYGTGALANAPVNSPSNGQVSITPGSFAGGTFNPNNYTITYTSGNITINPANLTITATANGKTYGTNLNGLAQLGTPYFTTSGTIPGETVTQVYFNINTLGGSQANANAGTMYNAQPFDLSPFLFNPTGTGGFEYYNYNINYVGRNQTILPAALTITAAKVNKTYGAVLTNGVKLAPAFNAAVLQNGETITSVTMTYGTGGAATDAVGTYTGTVLPSAPIVGANGFRAANYTISYSPGNIVVGVAPLTITATSFTKPYGTDLTSGPASTGFTTSPLQNSETVTSVNLGYDAAISPANAAIGTTGSVIPGPTVTGTGTFNASNYSITYTPGLVTVGAATFDWIGGVSTDWTTPGNWSINGVVQTSNYPGLNEATDVVQIGVIAYSNTANQPTYTTATPFTVTNLTIGNSGPVTLNINANLALTVTGVTTFNAGSNFTLTEGAGASLNLNGNLSNAGTLNFGASTINFSGTAAQNLTSSTPVAFANVSFSGGSTKTIAAGAFSVTSTGILTIGNNTTLNGNGLFSLISDVNGSASVAPVGAGGAVTNVNVQRYIPGHYRSYRLMSSPVNTGSTDGYGNIIYSINYLANTTYISGTNFTPSATEKKGNPSLYLHRENYLASSNSFLTSNYRGIADINSSPNYTINGDPGTFNIPVGNGYLFFFRGGLGTPFPFKVGSTPAEATLIATGTLNTGQFVMHDWYTPSSPNLGLTTISQSSNTEGFNLVGNPYACTIDLLATNTSSPTTGIYAPGTTPYIYELNPNGNYGVYTIDGSAPPLNDASRYIASGQGYLVHAIDPSAQYIFNESAKSVGTQVTGAALFMGKPADLTTNVQYLRLKMAMDSVNSDETIISFDKTTKAQYDIREDALYKIGSGQVGIASISVDKKTLAVNRMPLSRKIITVPLSVSAVANGTYSLTMNSLKGVPELYDIWLMDAYRKDSLDMRHNSTYRFDVIKTDTASFGAYRFQLVLRQNPALAYHLLNFAANKGTGKQVQLNWVTENEANYTNFTIERSTDGGKTYDVVGGVPSTGAGIYTLLDKYPGNNNLYRLKQEDINDSISYSHIIPVSFSNLSNNLASNNINVYPNPATSDVHLVVNSAIENSSVAYNFKITNSYGLLIKQGTSTQSAWQTSVSDLLPGTYIIEVINNKDQSLIGKTKLVKL